MKYCYKCQQTKTFESFNKNRTRNDGLQNECRECSKENSRKAWRENIGKYSPVSIARNKAKREEVRLWFKEFKKTLFCKRCGENHPATLDFHHREQNSKEYGVSQLASQAASRNKILNEIAKCDVLCSNCHRKLHYEETSSE